MILVAQIVRPTGDDSQFYALKKTPPANSKLLMSLQCNYFFDQFIGLTQFLFIKN